MYVGVRNASSSLMDQQLRTIATKHAGDDCAAGCDSRTKTIWSKIEKHADSDDAERRLPNSKITEKTKSG